MPARRSEFALEQRRMVHPLVVRVCHWVNAFAIIIMILSGWRIYDASPIFNFQFPHGYTLGGWLGGALQWHFAAMWLLVVNGLVYVIHGVFSGHYLRDFLPVSPRAVGREIAGALRFRLSHQLGRYNALQRIAYIGVIILGFVLVLSGLAIWKPVQFKVITALMGGFQGARIVHFVAMSGVAVFIVVHVLMVLLVPGTFLPMFTGRIPRRMFGSHG